jgi:hypothetical protein
MVAFPEKGFQALPNVSVKGLRPRLGAIILITLMLPKKGNKTRYLFPLFD